MPARKSTPRLVQGTLAHPSVAIERAVARPCRLNHTPMHNRARLSPALWTFLPTWLLLSSMAGAAEQCTLDADLAVPNTTEGLYLNLVTAVSGPSEGSVPGFDINIYAAASTDPSGQLKFYWGPATTGGAGVASVGDTYAVLEGGAVVGPDSLFTRAAFTGNTDAWQAGVTGFLGLRFRDEANEEIRYGWLLLSTSAPMGFPAVILGWCFEDSGAAISIPTLPSDEVFKDGFEA
jgi:hypothetical protein